MNQSTMINQSNNDDVHPAYDVFMLWYEEKKQKELEDFLCWRNIQIAKEEYEKAQLLGLKSKYDTNDNEADEEDLEVREGLLPGLF